MNPNTYIIWPVITERGPRWTVILESERTASLPLDLRDLRGYIKTVRGSLGAKRNLKL